MSLTQIRFAGLGGQGIILMGEILGEAAALDKKYVGQTSSYGAEARGSACRADVVISDSWIDYPEVTEADVLVCMSQGAYDLNIAKVNHESGLIFYDSQLVKPGQESKLRHIPVPATEKALSELGNRMVANIILLGAVVKKLNLVSKEALQKSLTNRVPASILELNKKALALGFEIVDS
ncbi:MAG: 2-oxoacid:acceptor oxidoreductase family protein [Thermodesulfobacteriota bacterium]